MRIAVTGATGLLGGNLAIELAARGHEVRATRRAGSRVAHLVAHPIAWVEASLDDPGALAAAFDGAEAVFHCAALVSIRKRVTPALVAANVDGTRHVIDAVRRAGVSRLVHCSTVGAVGLSEDGAPCTEDSPWNFDALGMDDGYVTTKRMSEDVVRDAVAGGLDAVIVNPAYMFGPYDARPSSGQLIVEVVRRRIPGWSPGRNNFVDVRDVARGMVAALERGETGRRYILGGYNLSYREIFERIAAVAGVRPPRWRLPRLAALAAGRVGDVHERLTAGEPRLNTVTARYGFCTTFQFSSERARAELGYETGPIETAIADAIAWFRDHGILPRPS